MMRISKVHHFSRWLHSTWMLLLVLVAISFPTDNSVEPIVTTSVLEHAPIYSPRIDASDDIDWDFAAFNSTSDKCPCAETLGTGPISMHPVLMPNNQTIRAPPAGAGLS